MNGVKLSVFDVIAFTLPGIVTELSLLILLSNSINSINDIIIIVKDLNTTLIFFLLGIAYIIGFSTFGLGSEFYKLCWRNKSENKNYSNLSKDWALIREFSPSNYPILQRWQALKGMSQNLTVSLIFLSIVSLIKFVNSNMITKEWILVSILSGLLSWSLMNRAKQYNEYKTLGLTNVIQVFKLNTPDNILLKR